MAVKGVETLHQLVEPNTGLGEWGATEEPLSHLRTTGAEVSECTTTTCTTAGDPLALVHDEGTNAPTEVTHEIVGDDAVAVLVLGVLVIPCELLLATDEPAVVPVERTVCDDENIGGRETCALGTFTVKRGTLVDDVGRHGRSPLGELVLPVPCQRWWADNQHLLDASVQSRDRQHDASDGLASALLVSDEELLLAHCFADNLNLMWHEVGMEHGLHWCHGQTVPVPWLGCGGCFHMMTLLLVSGSSVGLAVGEVNSDMGETQHHIWHYRNFFGWSPQTLAPYGSEP